MHTDRHFSRDDLRTTSDPKFQQPHFAEYLDATNKLDTYARERFGKRVIHLALRGLLDHRDQASFLFQWVQERLRPGTPDCLRLSILLVNSVVAPPDDTRGR
jgi:hypothetical protein